MILGTKAILGTAAILGASAEVTGGIALSTQVTFTVKGPDGSVLVGCLVMVESFDPTVGVPLYQTYKTDSNGQIIVEIDSVAPGSTIVRAYALNKTADVSVTVTNG